MTQLIIFLGFSSLAIMALLVAKHYRKISYKSLLGLFVFGMLMSVPFIMIEHYSLNLNFFHIIAAFLAIELSILFCEKHITYFHELIHHNIKELRIVSFLLIGLGFTYSEIGFTILGSTGDIGELINTIPFKTTYALLMHTVFAAAASLVHLGSLFAQDIFATIFKALTYYIRIFIISVSHYLYVFSVENNLMVLIFSLLFIGSIAFIYIKERIDLKPEAIDE